MMLPDWISKEQSISTKRKSNLFWKRNTNTFQTILTKVEPDQRTLLSLELHSVTWLILLISFLLALSFSDYLYQFWGLTLIIVGFLACLPSYHLIAIFKRFCLLLIFPIVLYLPSLFFHPLQIIFLIRTTLTVILVSIYLETSNLPSFLKALKKCYFPDIILLQIDFSIKYIYIFIRTLSQLLKAMEARTINQQPSFKVAGNIWAILFLKAEHYGKDMIRAMEARGYTGHYYRSKGDLNNIDYLLILISTILLLFFLIIHFGG